jgi:hypothetical protein
MAKVKKIHYFPPVGFHPFSMQSVSRKIANDSAGYEILRDHKSILVRTFSELVETLPSHLILGPFSELFEPVSPILLLSIF